MRQPLFDIEISHNTRGCRTNINRKIHRRCEKPEIISQGIRVRRLETAFKRKNALKVKIPSLSERMRREGETLPKATRVGILTFCF